MEVIAHGYALVETINPRMKEVPRGYLRAVVGATKRQVETKRVEEEVASGSIEEDLWDAVKVCDSLCTYTRCRISYPYSSSRI